jgi:hypothetical protein
MNPLPPEVYVTSLEEVLWGATLVAFTMVMHGFGMLSVLRVQDALKQRLRAGGRTFAKDMLRVVLASWMILLVHLVEVLLWAGFLFWKGAVNSPNANFSLSYYFSLNEYTTLGSDYDLIFRYRLLEGMIAVAGLMTFAWSTGVLFTLAQSFQQRELLTLEQKPLDSTITPTAICSRPPE